MRPVLRTAATLSVFLAIACAGSAWALKSPGSFTPVPAQASATLSKLRVAVPFGPQAVCQPGETRAVLGYLQYIIPPNDRYFTHINPSMCTTCSQGVIDILAGHMGIYFPAACQTVIAVSVVGAKPTAANPGCLVPDESNVLCGPLTYTVTPPAAGGYDVALPLPAGCCISGEAFLCFNFLASDCDPASDQLGIFATVAPCNPCESWNFYPLGAGTAQDDLCNVFSQYGAGNLYMYADADCCNSTPTRHGTWGGLKTIYR